MVSEGFFPFSTRLKKRLKKKQGQMGEDILFLPTTTIISYLFFSFFFWLQAEMKDFCGLYRYPPEFVVILVVVGVVAAAAAVVVVVVVVA